MKYPNLFKSRYNLSGQGKNWLKIVSLEDLKAFVHIGFIESDCGRLGGKVRAQSAKRDSRGRFLSDEQFK